MKPKYTMTDKRKEQDVRQANWQTRLEILRLRMDGWSFQQIAEKLGITRQRASQAYRLMGKMTIKEAERLAAL